MYDSTPKIQINNETSKTIRFKIGPKERKSRSKNEYLDTKDRKHMNTKRLHKKRDWKQNANNIYSENNWTEELSTINEWEVINVEKEHSKIYEYYQWAKNIVSKWMGYN